MMASVLVIPPFANWGFPQLLFGGGHATVITIALVTPNQLLPPFAQSNCH